MLNHLKVSKFARMVAREPRWIVKGVYNKEGQPEQRANPTFPPFLYTQQPKKSSSTTKELNKGHSRTHKSPLSK